MTEPSRLHFVAAKRILRYVKGMKNFGFLYLEYRKRVVGYTDSDWPGYLDDKRSILGYDFFHWKEYYFMVIYETESCCFIKNKGQQRLNMLATELNL